jgi:hypothetical protein
MPVRVMFYTGKYISSRDTDVMPKAYWFPTKWSAVRSRPGSKLLARRVARRGTPAFKAQFPRRWELETSEGPLVITQERPRHVPEQLFVYTTWPETSLARRADSNPELPRALWIDAHSLVQPCSVEGRRAIHEWPAGWPAESEDAEWLGWAEDVKDLPSVIPLLNYSVDYCHYSLYAD